MCYLDPKVSKMKAQNHLNMVQKALILRTSGVQVNTTLSNLTIAAINGLQGFSTTTLENITSRAIQGATKGLYRDCIGYMWGSAQTSSLGREVWV